MTVKIRRKINGEMWSIYWATREFFNNLEQVDDDTAGITYPTDKTIWICEDSFDEQTMRHELFHAYCWYLHLDPGATPGSIEETFAQWFEHRGPYMVKQARRLFKDLTKAVSKCKTEQK